MRIVFICGCLEAGRNGVGDYIRALGKACQERGHEITLLAIRDHSVSAFVENRTDGCRILQSPHLDAIPAAVVAEINNGSDLVSLQIVSFAYDPRGLPFGFGRRLQILFPKVRWHFMFHELWTGLNRGSALKLRIRGFLQRIVLTNWIHRFDPILVHTQCRPYFKVLSSLGAKPRFLPLFGNIPLHDGDGWALIRAKRRDGQDLHPDRAHWFLAGVFGSIHPEWVEAFDPTPLTAMAHARSCELALVLLGKNHLSSTGKASLESKMATAGHLWELGALPASTLSPVMAELDLGLPTTPLALVEKSGSAVAMEEHGMPLLTFRNEWELAPRWHSPAEPSQTSLVRRVSNDPKTIDLRKLPARSHLSEVTDTFLADLERSLRNAQSTQS